MSDSILAVQVHELAETQKAWADSLESYRDAELDETGWATVLKLCQSTLNVLEDERKELVEPATKDIARVNTLYRTAREPVEGLKKLCKDRLQELAEAKLLAASEAHATAEIAALAGDTNAAFAALQNVPDAGTVAGTRTTWEWHCHMVDSGQLPREWLVIDEHKLKRYLKDYAKSETIPAVPGLRFEKRAKVSVGNTK